MQAGSSFGRGNERTFTVAAVVLALFLAFLLAAACGPLSPPRPYRPPVGADDPGPHLDLRDELATDFVAAPTAAQIEAEKLLRQTVPEITVRYHRRTGAVRSLVGPLGGLTGPAPGAAAALADSFVRRHLGLLGLTTRDLSEMELRDTVPDPSGATHLYWRQRHAGIAVYNGLLQVVVEADGRVRGLSSSFHPALAAVAADPAPTLPAAQAVLAAARHLRLTADSPAEVSGPDGADRRTAVEPAGISREPIEARLMWLPITAQDVRLVWNFRIAPVGRASLFDLNVDAHDGRVLTRFDWRVNAAYRVYPRPVESPLHAAPAPPADARTLVADPHDPIASPHGWHDTDGAPGAEHTEPRGNNVFAYVDRPNEDLPPPRASRTECGTGLACDFALDLSADPLDFADAAVANVFYWANLFHDVTARHGFDPPSGAFQSNNYGLGGRPGDPVLAEVHNGWGADGRERRCIDGLTGASVRCANNAAFLPRPDGEPGRLEVYLFDRSGTVRDGAFDGGLVTHEMAHGLTARLVGGPASGSCTSEPLSIYEGVSDFLALVFTHRPGDTALSPRGVANWGVGDGLSAPGLRTEVYSLDPGLNTKQYEQAAECVQGDPHCFGEIWAQALWGVYWDLIGVHGFSPDLSDAAGGRGNQRMLTYLVRALKRTRCEADYLDARDGVVLALLAQPQPELCLAVRRLARFGLGSDALAALGRIEDEANGHGIPHSCLGAHDSEEWVRNPEPRRQGDDFGSSVVIRGDLAIVGAPGDANGGEFTGAAYALVRHPSGWRIEQKLTPPVTANRPRFGTSVDLKGNLAVIGAPRTHLPGVRGEDQGAAYVFRRVGVDEGSPRWQQEGDALQAYDAGSGDTFGTAVAISSRRGLVVVGAPHRGAIAGAGAAYVFEREYTGFGFRWEYQSATPSRSKLQSPRPRPDDDFGAAVAFSIDGDTILVGAPGDDDAAVDAGAAHVFTSLSATGTFRHAARLEGPPATRSHFGDSVALGTNQAAAGRPAIALVGAPRANVGAPRSGAAYLFEEPAGGWRLVGRPTRLLPSPGGGERYGFGYAVDMSGDHIVVSAPGLAEERPGRGPGGVFLFARQGRNWNQVRLLRRIGGVRHGLWGDGASISAGVVLVGASRDFPTDSGSIFFYE